MPVAERALYDWLNAAEGDVSGLVPAPRSDRGQRRVKISRIWDTGYGLPEDVQDQIAGKLAGVARGLLAKGRSERNVRTLVFARPALCKEREGRHLRARYRLKTPERLQKRPCVNFGGLSLFGV